jgi:hypothetical protein
MVLPAFSFLTVCVCVRGGGGWGNVLAGQALHGAAAAGQLPSSPRMGLARQKRLALSRRHPSRAATATLTIPTHLAATPTAPPSRPRPRTLRLLGRRTRLATRVSELLAREELPVQRLAVAADERRLWAATASPSVHLWEVEVAEAAAGGGGGGAGAATPPALPSTPRSPLGAAAAAALGGAAFVASPSPAARARLAFPNGEGGPFGWSLDPGRARLHRFRPKQRPGELHNQPHWGSKSSSTSSHAPPPPLPSLPSS